jgi:hypothetical protein
MLDPGVSMRLHALCLSGGGIRSAAFCLGVVQALARAGLLSRFHYLSTVSGGGYTGAMIWRLIKTMLDMDPLATVSDAEVDLASPGSRGFNWLRGIREYTSYLAPVAGPASLDIWAVLALYLRNTLVNFSVFLPGLIGFALVPRLYLRITEIDTIESPPPSVLLLCPLLVLFYATFTACISLPVHVNRPDRESNTAAQVIGQISFPAVAGWAFLIGVWFAWRAPVPDWLAFLGFNGWLPADAIVPIAAGIVMVLSYIAAPLFASENAKLFLSRNIAGWLFATSVDVGLLWLGAHLSGRLDSVWLAILAPPWVIAAQLLHAAIYAICRQETAQSWLDREWIARLSATEMLPGAGWALLGFVTIFLPHYLADHLGLATSMSKSMVGISALASGPLAALLGRGATTAPESLVAQGKLRGMLPNLLAWLASVFFMVGLLMLGSALGWRLVAWLWAPRGCCAELVWDAASSPCSPSVGALLGGVALLVGVSFVLGLLVNVNRYSLHEMYRNRLARAFLGAASEPRYDDGFTKFDEADRIALSRVATPHSSGGSRLFPVINTTMNLASGTRTAWAERKAASFVMTPLHCGSAVLDGNGVFVRTGSYGGAHFAPNDGVYLDTAMTISGAAVSPNAGYHSSPATAFIMTLFNARLGAWMPNPARAPIWAMRTSKPPNGFWALVAEMLGQTNDQRNAVYLSDGGHFENLGLYEMLRRRCAVVLVVDADCDPDYQYFDLGNAIRKARIDLGVEITFFPHEQPIAGIAPGAPLLRAQIDYPATGALAASVGILLYLKAHKALDMPADVMAFAAANPAFPHQSTGNQFFTESQFESYRRLGEFLAF